MAQELHNAGNGLNRCAFPSHGMHCINIIVIFQNSTVISMRSCRRFLLLPIIFYDTMR